MECGAVVGPKNKHNLVQDEAQEDLPERLEMQDRIEALGEEVKDLQRERRETFRRTRDLRSTADKLLETTLRNRDTPEFYSYY